MKPCMCSEVSEVVCCQCALQVPEGGGGGEWQVEGVAGDTVISGEGSGQVAAQRQEGAACNLRPSASRGRRGDKDSGLSLEICSWL